MIAAMFNRVEIVAVLLSHGANAQATDSAGNTAVDAAKVMGARDTVVLLEEMQTKPS
jgi:uncharacterized protein